MTVWYADQRPWISRDGPPTPVADDARLLAISTVLELMVLAFVVDPRRRWATALVERLGDRPAVRVSAARDRLRISWRVRQRRWALVAAFICVLWTGIWLNHLLGVGQVLTEGGLARMGMGTGLVALCVLWWLGGRASLQCTRGGVTVRSPLFFSSALRLHREDLRSVSVRERQSPHTYELLVTDGSGTEVALARFHAASPAGVAAHAVSKFLDLPRA
jgi:hypothetical protein